MIVHSIVDFLKSHVAQVRSGPVEAVLTTACRSNSISRASSSKASAVHHQQSTQRQRRILGEPRVF